MNYLWGIMILVGVIYGALTGNLGEVTDATLTSAKEAIVLCITMAGVMALWVGLMEIAEKAGMIRRATRLMDPILTFLFPRVPKVSRAREAIATNMIANFLGLGWAATPAGLEAMTELQKLKEESGARNQQELHTASREMCTFLIINISSLQLIPINILAYRSQYGSVVPSAIIGPGIAATCMSTLAAVIFCKIMDLIGNSNIRIR